MGGPDESPATFLDILVDKKPFTTTDEQGVFQIKVPSETRRLVATFRDPAQRYASTTAVVPFEQGKTVLHKIRLSLQDSSIGFQTSDELTVPLGHAADGSSMAELEVPRESFVTVDGVPFKGWSTSGLTPQY